MSSRTRLVKLSDSSLQVRPSDDIRGRKVYDQRHEEVGTVADLLVDESERRVRFLHVEAGGFLGVGTKDLMIPVDAVSGVDRDEVRIDQSRERLSGAPRYNPSLADEKYWADVYGYWGYSPYWTPGYTYPPWPGTVYLP